MIRSFTDEMRVSRFYELVKRLMDFSAQWLGCCYSGSVFRSSDRDLDR